MYDTTVMLKPRESVATGNDLRKADSGNGRETPVSRSLQHLDDAGRKPSRYGVDRNQDALGLKIQGPNLEGIQQVGAQVQQILSAIPEMRSIFAERVSQGFYLNVEVNRPEAARYGLTIADVQQAVTSGIGGENRR